MEKIEILKGYLNQADESDKEIIKGAIEALSDGITPSLPFHIEVSLLLKAKKLLPPESDFEALQEQIEEAKVVAKYDAIAEHIYSLYPQQKQSQDDKWATAYITKLKAAGVTDLEAKVVTMATEVFEGQSVDEVVADIKDATQKAMFAKLVKIAVRTQWAENCVIEGKKAIAEDKEPVFPDFPVL